MFIAFSAAAAATADGATGNKHHDDDQDDLDELHDHVPFDFVGLFAFVAAVAGLVYAALKLAGRGDMFGESGYLAEQERLAREEAARMAEEERAKETEYRLK
jgi:hypothetical protein